MRVSSSCQNRLSHLASLLRRRSAFSTLELLFAIMVLGIIAGIALPKIIFTRTNAVVVAIQSDISTIVGSVQEYALISEFRSDQASARWLVDHLNLSPRRWIAVGDILYIADDGKQDVINNCVSIRFSGTDKLEIRFDRSVQTSLCIGLLKQYTSDIIVPINAAL